MQLELEKELKKGGIVVAVYQQHEKGKKVLVNIWRDRKNNLKQFTCFLYRKAILKAKNIRISYNYNYSDKQIITITESFINYDNSITKTSFVFHNIPTKCGYLDIIK